jgi:hypothetical protein
MALPSRIEWSVSLGRAKRVRRVRVTNPRGAWKNMKCIKTKKTGTINRVEDNVADSEVTKGNATYCTKQEWKKSLTAKERKAIMDHNGGDPSVKKTDSEKAKSKGKKAKIDTSDVEKVEKVEITSDNIIPNLNETKSEPSFPENEAPAAPAKTESKAKRNKKDSTDKSDKSDKSDKVDAPKTSKTDKKPMINKPKVKKAKEE